MEFQKSAFWLGEKNARWINRLLGGVWLVYSSVSFTKLGRGMWPEISRASSAHTPMFFLGLLLGLVYFIGIIASLGIFNGARAARHYLLFLAGLDAFCGVIALLLKPNQLACAFYTIAGFITLWLLWPQSKAKLAAK
ncbi:MAG TPA: hypothetical protein VG347_00040 [Verrucomicrobiae bacterium]|nr:hypothetical protein [Verrucomicrobiae bacterium]